MSLDELAKAAEGWHHRIGCPATAWHQGHPSAELIYGKCTCGLSHLPHLIAVARASDELARCAGMDFKGEARQRLDALRAALKEITDATK